MRLTNAQVVGLETLAGEHWLRALSKSRTYNPLIIQERTFSSLADKGLAVWIDCVNGEPYAGYRITDAGNAEWQRRKTKRHA